VVYIYVNGHGFTENWRVADESSRQNLQAGVMGPGFYERNFKYDVLFIQGPFFDKMTKSKKKKECAFHAGQYCSPHGY
jgi:hypothetical protein